MFSREISISSQHLLRNWVYNTNVVRDLEKKRLGALGETIASRYLEKKGFKILDRNYRKPWGEIDIVAEKGKIVRFVEVKSVSRESLPDISREMEYRPEELVDARKLRKLARTAQLYMEVKKDEREYQIDVVGVVLSESTRVARCRLFEQVLGDDF